MRTPATTDHPTQRRAIGLTRVSVEGAREHIHSYATQAERIEQDCAREGATLLYIGQERNVSGGADLANRPELSRAVAAIEAGEANIIIAAYFDRFFRSLEVQAEVIGRVERAGGEVLTLDHGKLTNGTPAIRLQANIVGAMSQYFREQTAEKAAEGQARAVARGATPWARVQIGYNRRDNGTLEPNPAEIPIAKQVFSMRAEGKSITQIREMLRSHGIKRSHRGVQVMLASRTYLGEIHFGEMVNLDAHEAIIDRELFDRVQLLVIPRGRKPKSDRLLSRLGILRCGSCGARLSPMKLPKQGGYPIYRCPSTSDCSHHVTISAVIVEDFVTDAVKSALADAEGRASMALSHRQASGELLTAQQTYDAFTKVFDPCEPADVARRTELKQSRDDAQARVNQLGPRTDITINAGEDWDKLSLDGRRELIRAVVERVTIAPGRGSGLRGAERIAVALVS